MLGKVVNYDEVNELGYIEGYDETMYFFHQINVKKNEKLKNGDIVSFSYLLEENEDQLPYAINIEKEIVKKRSKPYKELYEILNYIPEHEKEKISKQFLKNIKDNMDTNYEYEVTHFEDFENQEMLDETRALLAIVYRDYLASPEEKEEIIKKEKAEFETVEKEKQKKYNPDDIFKDRQTIDERAIVEIKTEKWYERVISFFKKILKK